MIKHIDAHKNIDEDFGNNGNPYSGANVHFNGEYEKFQN